VPLEILHRAAPCRNVPVTFTLDRMKGTTRETHPHPRAVVLARIFLCLVGTFFVVAGVAMSLEAVASPAWWAPVVAVLIGGALLLSGAFEGSRGMVATFLIFFFPWT
jgi:fatty acid desaturase